MEIAATDARGYRRLFPCPAVVYNSVDFTELNSYKVAEVRRLVLSARGKPRLGLTVGIWPDGSVSAPYSAPFACFDFNRAQSAATMLEAAAALRELLPGMRLVLPPPVYSPSMTGTTLLALLQAGATVACTDWNYHLDLRSPGGYEALLGTDARKKLHRAAREGLSLVRVDDAPMRAYRVIEANRRERGYPLRMSADMVLATVRPRGPVKADFFVMTHRGADVAAALVYEAAADVAQVIYWGDIPGGAPQYTMNLLAAMLYSHYREAGMRILDIGPSSEGGIASPGLCAFKESVGCVPTPKPTLLL